MLAAGGQGILEEEWGKGSGGVEEAEIMCRGLHSILGLGEKAGVGRRP